MFMWKIFEYWAIYCLDGGITTHVELNNRFFIDSLFEQFWEKCQRKRMTQRWIHVYGYFRMYLLIKLHKTYMMIVNYILYEIRKNAGIVVTNLKNIYVNSQNMNFEWVCFESSCCAVDVGEAWLRDKTFANIWKCCWIRHSKRN